ncbi:site-2 protease family protein [Sulfitobacter sp. SK011]|uniref:site-2 protease family protein n=1 Tax=Sulfitobacter sp. SK011 TaxID=1389004 RepID=UPI000E09FC1E|nr:site-2 protease family protein [Sulfitobacter sp. SK011]AXI44191.1 site-2 protease family protein [Sulfitobacter sp. SK011]
MFSQAKRILYLNGFEIKVDPSWLVIAALITWSLSQQYFPDILPNASAATHLMMALISMLALFASLLLHELAHSVVARRLGLPVKSITLFLFGGVAELEAEPSSARVEFWVALAGPVMSLCLAGGFWTLTNVALFFGSEPALREVISYLALINLVLALFNMVPAFPLDGGRMLRAYLWHRTGDALAATKTAAQSGAFFAYALMALGVMALFQGALVAGLWQLMIGGFLLIAARSSYNAQLARVVFEGKSVDAMMKRDPITVGPEMTLAELADQIMLRHGVSFVPVLDDSVLLGHIDTTVLSSIDRENWSNTRVGDVFVGLDQNVLVPPELPVPELLGIIANTGRRKFLVVSDHRLVGVITLADLTRFLNLGDLAQSAK